MPDHRPEGMRRVRWRAQQWFEERLGKDIAISFADVEAAD